MSPVATRNLTTLDLVKTLAVFSMVADHVGAFFFPVPEPFYPGDPMLWFRVAGRMCIPVWFFLVGYARSRDLSWPIWLWGGGLATFVFLNTGAVFPLNSLFLIIAIRLVIDFVGRFSLFSSEQFFLTLVLITVLFVPSNFVLEYGTLGLLIALLGYAARQSIDRGSDPYLEYWGPALLIALLVTLLQWAHFPFSLLQGFTVLGGTAAILLGLLRLKVQVYTDLNRRLGPIVSAGFRLCGRRTMEIYVLHFILFFLLSEFVFKIPVASAHAHGHLIGLFHLIGWN